MDTMTHHEIAEKIREFVYSQRDEFAWFLNELSPEIKVGDKFKRNQPNDQNDESVYEVYRCGTNIDNSNIFYKMKNDSNEGFCLDAETIKEFMEKVNEHAKAH